MRMRQGRFKHLSCFLQEARDAGQQRVSAAFEAATGAEGVGSLFSLDRGALPNVGYVAVLVLGLLNSSEVSIHISEGCKSGH